jgi:hypothetical protein
MTDNTIEKTVLKYKIKRKKSKKLKKRRIIMQIHSDSPWPWCVDLNYNSPVLAIVHTPP